MKICKCGNEIPKSKIIDNKKRNLQNRTLCLECLPFGESRYRKKTIEEIREYKANKARNNYNKKKLELGIDPIRALRERRKKEIVDLIGGKCQICGYNRVIRNLAFHHISNKKFTISSRAFQYSMDSVLTEVKKCILVCHNCHGEIHDGIIDNTIIVDAHSDILRALNNL